jgi:uncharacterized protein DUF1963
MRLECQLVTHGLYCGDDVAWKSARGAELAPGAPEWRLLFQMDSDDDVGVMWGDCGLIYYWIRESDLRTHGASVKRGRFCNARDADVGVARDSRRPA